MIINRDSLIETTPVYPMETVKRRLNGLSYGLSETGYDIRVKQEIKWVKEWHRAPFFIRLFRLRYLLKHSLYVDGEFKGIARFTLASSVEMFTMPPNLVGEVKDKSSHARPSVSVYNTVIEPGWTGFLTLEIVLHGEDDYTIPAGTGIAQVIFSELKHSVVYNGKYQGQPDLPVEAILEKDSL